MATSRSARAQRLWIGFCRLLSRIFFRRTETAGAEHLRSEGPMVVVANHSNAFVDVLLLQAAAPRALHPLARSGLFDNRMFRPVLSFVQAVPMYRRQDRGSDTRRNRGSFDRCFELLAAGEALVMFPEGVSHSQPALRELKTGAARIAFGSVLRGEQLPVVVPAGLTYVEKGSFRSRVLLQIGAPVELSDLVGKLDVDRGDDPDPAVVRRATVRIERAIRSLTLNAESWEDLLLARQLERFLHFRRRRHPGSHSLKRRFRTVQRLLEAHRRLRAKAPAETERLRRRLRWFERLRRLYGIEDYHLRRSLRLGPALRWLFVRLATWLAIAPMALYGWLTSGPAYWLIARLTRTVSERFDQYDTNRILLALGVYGGLWGGASTIVAWRFGPWPVAVLFVLSLPFGLACALAAKRLGATIREESRVFLLLRRREELRDYLISRRLEIEEDLVRLARWRTGDAAPQ